MTLLVTFSADSILIQEEILPLIHYEQEIVIRQMCARGILVYLCCTETLIYEWSIKDDAKMAFSVQSDPYIIMSSSFSASSRVCLMSMVRNGYKIAFLSDYSFKNIIRYICINKVL